MLSRQVCLVLPVLAMVLVAHDEIIFNLKDPKGVNSVTWLVDSPLEPISGTAAEITGTVVLDREHLDRSSGRIEIATKSLRAPVPGMTEHLLGEQWLNAEKHPKITFTVKEVADLEVEKEGVLTAKVTGDFHLNGITKELSAPIRVQYLKEGLTQKMRERMKGDLIHIRSDFTLSRKDFGINNPSALVGDKIEIRLAIIGVAPKA